MCGLTYIRCKVTKNTRTELLKYTTQLIDLSRRRGSDARGIYIFTDESTYELKETSTNKRSFKEFIRKIVNMPTLENQHITILAHTRMRTNGSLDDLNTQPLQNDFLTIAHNGILINEDWFDAELIKKGIKKIENNWSDTRKAIHAFNLDVNESHYDSEVERIFSEFDGANNAIVHSQKTNKAYFFTTHGSLFFCQKDEFFACSSEKLFLENVVGIEASGFSKNIVYTFVGGAVKEISKNLKTQKLKKAVPTILVEQSKIKRFEEKLIDSTLQVENIQRCTSCLMPITTPFINMNNAGECVYCQHEIIDDWTPKKDLSELVENLSRQKRVLFPFSGGRDSSFGLAKLRELYDGEIIAYTYDWGMVTDLARRNISSLCGQYGIEHVLISADINKKLLNVKKNISAWLKKPNLGVVPLFMAGDKQYFYYINKLMSERDVDLAFLCSNPFERTNFKTGFCGVDVNKSNQASYHAINSFDKIKMIAFYAAQFVKNPRYVNTSLLDTAGAFISYYGIEHNYLSFFDYYQWREDEVESALIDDLRWEFSADTDSSWRIGDGTAPFYNYIYLQMAGFTENDALRSNQVRAGHLSRDEAFKLLVNDNKNRAESLYWYFERLGLDPFDTIDAFHSKL